MQTMMCIKIAPTASIYERKSGRGGGTRTPDLRFWRPLLFQLSYAPAIRLPSVDARI